MLRYEGQSVRPVERLSNPDFLGKVVHFKMQTDGKPFHFELTLQDLPQPRIATTQFDRHDMQETVAFPAYRSLQQLFSGETTVIETDNRQTNSSVLITTESGLIACMMKTNNKGERTGLDLIGGGPKHQFDYKLGPMGAVESLGEEAITVYNDQIYVPEEDAAETVAALKENIIDYQWLGGEIPHGHKKAFDRLCRGDETVIKTIPYGFHPTITPIIEAAIPTVDISSLDREGNVMDFVSGKIDIHTEGSDFLRGFCIPDGAGVLDTENFYNPETERRENTNRDVAFLTMQQVVDIGRGIPIYNVLVSHFGELHEETMLHLRPRAHMQEFSNRIAPFENLFS